LVSFGSKLGHLPQESVDGDQELKE
jgi:hypothetical protein